MMPPMLLFVVVDGVPLLLLHLARTRTMARMAETISNRCGRGNNGDWGDLESVYKQRVQCVCCGPLPGSKRWGGAVMGYAFKTFAKYQYRWLNWNGELLVVVVSFVVYVQYVHVAAAAAASRVHTVSPSAVNQFHDVRHRQRADKYATIKHHCPARKRKYVIRHSLHCITSTWRRSKQDKVQRENDLCVVLAQYDTKPKPHRLLSEQWLLFSTLVNNHY